MIQLKNVYCSFDGNRNAVSGLSLEVREGETLALLGTSGAGKSTTLKMINGLIRPTEGEVFFGERPLDYTAIYAARLKMGYVIQEVGLFPHLDVFKNISIMARMLRWKKTKRLARAEELLELVGLEPKRTLNKYPWQLSGGEAQRVGFARALMLDPPCLLMDEPFGALDPITRRQLQDDYLKLEEKIQKTVVLVTHDVQEAYKLASRIAVMHAGKLVQCDTAEALRQNPANDFVRQFIGCHSERSEESR